MKRTSVVMTSSMFLFLSIAIILSSCGGGGGGGSSAPAGVSLVGTWFGTLEDASGTLATLQVTVNANNTVTDEKVNGSATGVTHTISLASGQTQVYDATGSDGTSGGFFADSTGTHVVFTNDIADFAVLQKGATSLPTYATADFVGSWSGFTVELNSSGGIETYNSNATVQSNGAISGSNKYGSFSGSFTGSIDTTYGGAWGDITSPASEFIGTFLSADKTFAGTYACPSSGTWDQCSWSAWRK